MEGDIFAHLKKLDAMNGSHNNHWCDYTDFTFIMIVGKQHRNNTLS